MLGAGKRVVLLLAAIKGTLIDSDCALPQFKAVTQTAFFIYRAVSSAEGYVVVGELNAAFAAMRYLC